MTSIYLKEGDDLMFLKMKTTSKKLMQPKTIKSKYNGCGTAPGNLVYYIIWSESPFPVYYCVGQVYEPESLT